MKGNMCFPLTFKCVDLLMENKATVAGSSLKWHRRFEYLNYDSLRMLQERNMVYGIPLLANCEHVCEGCAREKAHIEALAKDKT